jgi:hypothetical protein
LKQDLRYQQADGQGIGLVGDLLHCFFGDEAWELLWNGLLENCAVGFDLLVVLNAPKHGKVHNPADDDIRLVAA